MHELSIVQSLISLCQDNADKNRSKKITQLEIKIGKLSGIEPDLLQSAYEVFREGTICENAKLIIHIQDIVVICKSCSYEGGLSEYEFICPRCKNVDLEVVDGEDMMLMRLVME